jgi:acetyl-CoA synthetase
MSLDATPAWKPDAAAIKKTNIAKFMAELQIDNLKNFHAWTVEQYETFWERIIEKLNIVFKKPPEKICDLSSGAEYPHWLRGAKFNIVDSCFTAAADQIAIIFQSELRPLQKITYAELHRLVNRVANSLVAQGFLPGDRIAIVMPMTTNAVAIYLGIIKMGGVVVSIADSFSAQEIATRLHITQAKAIFTQDVIARSSKNLPLYEKIVATNAPCTIVLSSEDKLKFGLRSGDLDWAKFLVKKDSFSSHPCDPMTHCNILFSSGTTGEPKAIPWSHTTPIKCGSDGYFHQNIQTGDILAWPTNLGWMMGPWLLFAGLLNQASLALYEGVPHLRTYGEFIQNSKVTLLGVVPTLVAKWRHSRNMEGLDWSAIKLFTSTGECSNVDDMLYLMSLANNKPIIEYCGGTEIGGAYIASTLIENNDPCIFTTPAMGSDFIILDENGKPSDHGEVALIPPSIGLSTELLNADHHAIYFAGMPTTADGKVLRRHGDQIQRLANGNYFILGRVDDEMNLGAIKVSAVEIERALVGIEGITETAAIAIPLSSPGRSHLIIYAATTNDLSKKIIKELMQERINQHLNPLFKIHDVLLVPELPKTASNKIMRRTLREQYAQSLMNHLDPATENRKNP